MSGRPGSCFPRWSILSAVLTFCLIGSIGTILSHPPGAAADDQSAAPAPLAVGDYEVDGVEVALLSVKRVSDGTLTVKWSYRNKTNEPKKLGESFEGMGSSEAYSLVWHAYLVDAKNKMKYPVVKDSSGDPVAARHAPGKVVILGPKKTLNTWAKFIAVPAGTKKISVFIPGTQPFEDVPISE
jgi:hypothetical protein